MTETIKFTVISGGINVSASYCTLNGYTSTPTLKIGDKVQFNCYFKDGRGNEVTISRFNEISEYTFSCEVKRTSPTSKTYTKTFTDKSTYYQMDFTIEENGVYYLYGYLTKKGTSTKTTMKGKIYQINVASDVSTINNSKIYNYYTRKKLKYIIIYKIITVVIIKFF